MKKIKTTTRIVFLSLFLISSAAFATDDEEDDGGTDPTEETITEDECGFFCSIGEFFTDLFS